MHARRVVLDDRAYILVSLPLRDDPRVEVLTPSERAIAGALICGASNKMVASVRATSIRTVANQVQQILSRLRVSSRADLVRTYGAVELRPR